MVGHATARLLEEFVALFLRDLRSRLVYARTARSYEAFTTAPPPPLWFTMKTPFSPTMRASSTLLKCVYLALYRMEGEKGQQVGRQGGAVAVDAA